MLYAAPSIGEKIRFVAGLLQGMYSIRQDGNSTSQHPGFATIVKHSSLVFAGPEVSESFAFVDTTIGALFLLSSAWVA
jgi:hypothetical protein